MGACLFLFLLDVRQEAFFNKIIRYDDNHCYYYRPFLFYFSQPKKFERSSSRCDVTVIVENTSIVGCVYRCSFLFSTLLRGGDVGEVRERKEGKVTREEV